MTFEFPAWLALLFFAIAFLHSGVGLAGGSSYTAVMAAFGVPLAIVPSVSLSLNALVSSVGLGNFRRHLRLRLLWPFLLGSIPMAIWGAHISLPPLGFYLLLFITLFLSLMRMIFSPQPAFSFQLGVQSRWLLSLALGAALGFLAGCVGIGGGIYLLPCLLLFGIAPAKQAAALCVAFIWINSCIGLLSKWQLGQVNWQWMAMPLLAVLLGGGLGSWLGASRWQNRQLEWALMLVLSLACLLLLRKMLTV